MTFFYDKMLLFLVLVVIHIYTFTLHPYISTDYNKKLKITIMKILVKIICDKITWKEGQQNWSSF